MYGDDFVQELEAHEAQFPEDRKRAALLLSLHSVQDRQSYVPADAIDWRHYYMDVLYPGLHTWCLPLLEGGEVPEDPAMVPALSLTPAAPAKQTVRA